MEQLFDPFAEAKKVKRRLWFENESVLQAEDEQWGWPQISTVMQLHPPPPHHVLEMLQFHL